MAALLTAASGVYAVRHFAINTNIDTLISRDLPWRQREIAFEKAFPQHLQSILVVVEAPTPELTSQATELLVERLSTNKKLFKTVVQPGGGAFFRQNGLLFLPVAETEKVAGQLAQAEPLISQLATDPSLRGLVEVRESFAGLPVVVTPYLSAEPIGVAALAALAAAQEGGSDVLAPVVHRGLAVEQTGEGFLLTLPLPLAHAADLALQRRQDELVVTVGEHRRVLTLPAALQRCVVEGASVRDGLLRVRFVPDEEVWPRG